MSGSMFALGVVTGIKRMPVNPMLETEWFST